MKNPFKNNFWREPVWSDPVKWWMDLLKNGLTFLIGTLITVSFVKQCDRRQFEWQSQYGYRLETLKEYEKNSTIYLKWSFDAFHEACSCKRPETSERMRGWLDEGYDSFNYALERIGTGLSTVKPDGALKKAVDSLVIEESHLRSMHNQLLIEIARKKPSFCQNDSARLFWDAYKHDHYFPQRSKMNRLQKQIMQLAQEQLSAM